MLEMLKKRIACYVVNSAAIVVELFSMKAPCLYLQENILIAFLRSVLLKKIKRTKSAIKRQP